MQCVMHTARKKEFKNIMYKGAVSPKKCNTNHASKKGKTEHKVLKIILKITSLCHELPG